jgi:erythromycin esterase
VYDPAQDAQHYYELPSLRDSFDAVVVVPTVTPTRPLPSEARRDVRFR